MRRRTPPPPPPIPPRNPSIDTWPDDEATIIDGAPFAAAANEVVGVDFETITPVSPPRCVECGNITFADTADLISSYPFDRCLHSVAVMPPDHPAAGKHRWHWCKTLLKSVSYDLRRG